MNMHAGVDTGLNAFNNAVRRLKCENFYYLYFFQMAEQSICTRLPNLKLLSFVLVSKAEVSKVQSLSQI